MLFAVKWPDPGGLIEVNPCCSGDTILMDATSNAGGLGLDFDEESFAVCATPGDVVAEAKIETSSHTNEAMR